MRAKEEGVVCNKPEGLHCTSIHGVKNRPGRIMVGAGRYAAFGSSSTGSTGLTASTIFELNVDPQDPWVGGKARAGEGSVVTIPGLTTGGEGQPHPFSVSCSEEWERDDGVCSFTSLQHSIDGGVLGHFRPPENYDRDVEPVYFHSTRLQYLFVMFPMKHGEVVILYRIPTPVLNGTTPQLGELSTCRRSRSSIWTSSRNETCTPAAR